MLVPAASSSARPRPAGDVDDYDGCSIDAGGHGEDNDACPDYPGVPDHDAGEPAHGEPLLNEASAEPLAARFFQFPNQERLTVDCIPAHVEPGIKAGGQGLQVGVFQDGLDAHSPLPPT